MNRMVNCSSKVLVELCHDDSWYKIIKHRNHVRIPDKNPLDLHSYVKDEPKNEWELLDRDGVRIHDLDTFAKDAISFPVKMLKHPNDFYLYDQPLKTEEASSLYGVMAASNILGSSKCLKRQWKYDIEQGKEYSWHDFLKKYHTGAIPPSNSLVILDRYLFSDNTDFGTDYKNGIRNLYSLIYELLPKSFRGDYHILIVFDERKISPGATLYDVVDGLQAVKSHLKKPFNIIIEVLTVGMKTDPDFYSETHDRRLLSNYFSIHATHGFSAFQPEEADDDIFICETSTIPSWSQRLTFESIYAGIDDEDQDLSSLPVRTNERSLALLREYVNSLKGNNRGFRYVRDGLYNQDIRTMKNRLIVC